MQIKYILFYLIFFILFSCARQSSPTGGEKDIKPPILLESKPDNLSKNFKSKKIILKFDEYVQLKDVKNNLLVSPPMLEKAEIKLKGKSILIKLKSKLDDSTTYNFNFGDAIVDNNEGNILKDFKFIFSTSNEIDSFSISGNLKNAFDLKAEEDVMVMIYENLNDTAPQKTIPIYIDRTDENGNFFIKNIKKKKYKIFALKDANSNFLFDMPNENIAFLDTFFIPTVELDFRKDTIKLDSLKDSIVTKKYFDFKPNDIELFLFEEDNKRQFLMENIREKAYKCIFIFNRNLKENLKINILGHENTSSIIETNPTKDTIFFWIKDSLIYKKDTLNLSISYAQKDSTENFQLLTDTLKMVFKDKKIKKKGIFKKKKIINKEKLKYLTNVKNGQKINFNSPIYFKFENPIKKIDNKKIKLYKIVDSLKEEEKFFLKKSDKFLRNFFLNANWQENSSYELLIDSLSFLGISDLYNDSILYKFQTQEAEFYGKIILNLEFIKNKTKLILQLMDEKNNIIAEKFLKLDEKKIEFDFLEPGNYFFKIIFDENGNKKWDTGNYKNKIQPEKTKFYMDEINVRSNWEMEIHWKL